MSNVIKAYSVRLEEEMVKTIDCHLKRDSDINEKRSYRIASPAEVVTDGFVEGLQAVVVEAIPNTEEITEKANKLIEDAKKEAKAIMNKAKLEAEQLKAETLAAAKKKGYEDGQQQSLAELQRRKAELEQLKQQQQEEYQAYISELEPKTAEILAELITKITGILIEEHKDVILYLVERAFLGLDKADSYTIRVSSEDYELVAGKKDYLTDLTGRDITLIIQEDQGLMKNQCLIETELKVIDCSLDVQLTNLISDLKLLGTL